MLCLSYTRRSKYARFDHLLVCNTEFHDLVIVTTSEECSFFFDNMETPSLTVVMRVKDDFLSSAININDLNDTIIVTKKDLVIQEVDG